MKKVIAVAEAGLLDFSFARNPGVKPDSGSGRFVLHLAGKPEVNQACDVFVDARIPKTALRKDASLFYHTLRETGEVREFSNGGFEPGGVDIDRDGNTIGKDGWPNERLTFYATPTEGVIWDNDTLSRSQNDFTIGWARRVAREIAQNR